MFIISTILFLIQSKRNMELKREFKIYKSVAKCEIGNLRKELLKETARADMLESRNNHQFNSKEHLEIPERMIEAVKYAMNKSHPDNGEKQEDFIKFRKLYEELKGME